MPKSFFNIPNHVVSMWPEIFEDLYMNTIPVSYIDQIRLEFSNGRIWEIDVKSQLVANKNTDVVNKIIETFYEYQSEITKLDFKIDISKLKNDIVSQTNNLL